MDITLRGTENRRKRARKLWIQWWYEYTREDNPLTVDQIAKKYKKKNGKPYTPAAIFKAFRALREEL